MLNKLLRMRRISGDVRAARRGPRAVGRRAGRRGIRRLISRVLR